MEESLRYSDILNKWNKERIDIRTYSPLTLAYIGDDVYDMVIRSLMIASGNASVNKLHQRTAKRVKAESQSFMAHRMTEEGFFDEEELDIYRRGRNAKSHTIAKNASVSDYRSATGFEAVIGYLYMQDRIGRIYEIIEYGLGFLEE